uniref:SFRICE_000302 n=1 Tax=Spodoptera frugiperda TaxID=7108 RepID=A0A2H1V7I1_SPOFR
MGDNIKVRYCNLKNQSATGALANCRSCTGGTYLRPFLCYERLKNPDLESSMDMGGSYTNSILFSQAGPQQRCDVLPSLNKKNKKKSYRMPSLSYHRIKNPEWPRRPISSNLDFNI